MTKRIRQMNLADRLATFADKPDECWLWPGVVHGDGYGRTKAMLRGYYRTVACHRFAYETLVGPVPDGMELDHLCSNRRCMNPRHLEPVTHAENVRRGEAGRNMSERTHCNRGHEFTPENTRRRHDHPGRVCIVCARAKCREQQRRRRAAARQMREAA